MNREHLQSLRNAYRDGLLNDVVPFWLRHALDREHGGYFTCLDRDGTVIDTDKAIWLQGRFSWLLSELYNTVEARADWLDAARLGIEFLERHGYDRAGDGRLFFHVTREGRPIRKRRYNFSECFAAIGYAAYARAAGSEYHRDKAIELFRNFVAYNTTPGAMPPKFTDERPLQGMGFRMMTIVTAQELRASIAYEEADARIESAIDTIRAHFVKPDLRVVMESVGPQGEIVDHFGGRMLNPGHAIEAAWFILREAKHRDGDRELLRLGLDMLDWMWARGWDEEYGGILYFRDLKHLPVQEYWHDMKFWWPQCETIIATLMAYRLTGDEKYARWHARIHDWTHARFPDPEYGEWFGYLHRDGRLSVPLKGNLWKGPFHIPRMQLVCWRLTDELAAHSAGLPNSFARSGAQ